MTEETGEVGKVSRRKGDSEVGFEGCVGVSRLARRLQAPTSRLGGALWARSLQPL